MGIPKKEALEIIKGKGYNAELSDGIITFKDVDANEIRKVMEEIDYRASWGITYKEEQ